MIDGTPLFRVYANARRRRLQAEQPVEAQRRTLRRLLKRAAATRFGHDHCFNKIDTPEAFRTSIPLRRYEAFWQDYWQASFPVLDDISWPGRIPYFAVTSGTTTGVTKYIPLSQEMCRANTRAGAELFVHHLTACPHSRVLGGLNFMLGGSTALEELAPGIWSGDLSGIAAKIMPWWARLRYFPPRELETMADWEAKIAAFAEAARNQDIRSIAGVPSWMLILFDHLTGLKPESGGDLSQLFPTLELLVHGGVNFQPYRSLFADRLANSTAETREVYSASEGFIAVADRGDGEGLRMILDNGLFYEFVPVEELDAAEPTRHWIGNAELGVNYALVLSSNAGVWGYVLGDTVRLVDRDPPRLLITGRTSYTLSAFGEHLIAEEIEAAVAAAAGTVGRHVADWSVGAVFPTAADTLGGHLYIVEFADDGDSESIATTFADTIDAELQRRNDDYRSHRASGYGMRDPVVHIVAPGTFAGWMKSRGKLGGQHKVPRIITDDALFADLRSFAKA